MAGEEEQPVVLDDFEAVFRAYFPAVYRFIVRRVGMTLAEDLAAETFAIAYRKRGAFRADLGSVRSWLYGIAVNLLRNHWRAEQRVFEHDAAALLPQAVSPECPEAVDQRLAAAALAPVIAGALASLSRQQREVLLLFAWAELSQEEIGSALGLSPGAVRSRLFRARAALRASLGEFNFDQWTFEGHEDE